VPTITIAAVAGDLMFARDVTTLMQQHGAAYPFERVLPLFEGTDLLIGNLEGTFTDRGKPQEKILHVPHAARVRRGADAGRFRCGLAGEQPQLRLWAGRPR